MLQHASRQKAAGDDVQAQRRYAGVTEDSAHLSLDEEESLLLLSDELLLSLSLEEEDDEEDGAGAAAAAAACITASDHVTFRVACRTPGPRCAIDET